MHCKGGYERTCQPSIPNTSPLGIWCGSLFAQPDQPDHDDDDNDDDDDDYDDDHDYDDADDEKEDVCL